MRGDGALVAVDVRTGRQLWRTTVPMATVSAPVTGAGLVVVAGVRDCADPHLSVVAVDAKTGRPAWQRSVAADDPCGIGVPLRLAGDVVVAGGPIGGPVGGEARPGNPCDKPVPAGSGATGLDLATGNPRWQAPSAAGQVLATSTGIVIANGTSPGCIVGLDPATGRIRWTVAPAVVPFDIAIGGNTAFAQGQVSGGGSLAVSAFDARTGKASWQVSLPPSEGGFPPLAVADVVVATTTTNMSDYTFTSLDPATGRQLWQATEQDSQTWTTAGPGVVLITRFTDLDRATIEAHDPRTGVRRWVSGDVGGIGTPSTDGATVITYSPQGASGLSAADGHQLWTVPCSSCQAAAVTADAAYLSVSNAPKNQPQGD